MAAQFIPIGEAAHDAERQALRFLVEGLPADYTVYGNPSKSNPTEAALREPTTTGGSPRKYEAR
jgi:hypothetical protein